MKQRGIEKSGTRVALITGGSTGIGAACVRMCLTAGWNVSVLALAGPDLEWLRSLGVVVTAGDITCEKTREAALNGTLASFGRIDVLVNNAGVGLYALPTATSPAHFTRLLDVNVVAPLALAQSVIPVMQDQGFGTIVTMSSVAARAALPWAAAYSASKAALDMIHNSLRVEMKGSSVHLLKVYPGIVDTEFRQHVLAGQAPEQVQNIRYVISPDDLAAAIFRSVERRHKTLYMPAIGRLFSLINALAPALMDLYLSRLLTQVDFMQSRRDRGLSDSVRNGD